MQPVLHLFSQFPFGQLGYKGYDISSVKEIAGTGESGICNGNTNLYDFKIYDQGINEIREQIAQMPFDKAINVKDNKLLFSTISIKLYKTKHLISTAMSTIKSPEYTAKGYTENEYLLYDISSDNASDKMSDAEKEKYQFLHMIANYYTQQGSDTISFYELTTTNDSGIKTLISDLLNGKAVIIATPKHAINAIRIYQLANGTGYRLFVYDNNAPGQERYIDIIKKHKYTSHLMGTTIQYYEAYDAFNIMGYGSNANISLWAGNHK